MLQFTNVTISRDTVYTNPTFEFSFKFQLPKANKERLILERDQLGRIVHSKPPIISV